MASIAINRGLNLLMFIGIIRKLTQVKLPRLVFSLYREISRKEKFAETQQIHLFISSWKFSMALFFERGIDGPNNFNASQFVIESFFISRLKWLLGKN